MRPSEARGRGSSPPPTAVLILALVLTATLLIASTASVWLPAVTVAPVSSAAVAANANGEAVAALRDEVRALRAGLERAEKAAVVAAAAAASAADSSSLSAAAARDAAAVGTRSFASLVAALEQQLSLQQQMQMQMQMQQQQRQVQLQLPGPLARPSLEEPRVFWTSDLHDGTRCDPATTLTVGLGQDVILGGVKDRRAAHPGCLAGVRWPRREYSELIRRHDGHNHYISEEEVRANFEYYKNDTDIAEVDAFYCSFPMSYCEAWLPFNKTLIYLAGHRFSLARCNEPQVTRLIKHLQEAEALGHIVASTTTYDAAYINYFTGLRPLVLRWSALYYASWRMFPPPPRASMRQEILVGPLQRGTVLFGDEIARACGGRFNFATARQLYGRFELENLVQHRAAVLFPYVAHSSFGIAEIYALGVPIFVPTPEFLQQLGIVNDRLMTSTDYCGPDAWFAPRHPQSLHLPNPEIAGGENELYWLRLAEYYQLPFITTFSSFADLGAKLDAAGDFSALRATIAARLEVWEGEVKAEWGEVVARIPKGRAVPRSYEEALEHVVRAGSVQAQ